MVTAKKGSSLWRHYSQTAQTMLSCAARWREDIALLRSQSERCREILGKLTSLGNEPAGPLGTMTLSLLIEEVAGPHRP